MITTREMQRFIDGVAVHPTIFVRGAAAYRGLAAIRDAALTFCTVSFSVSKDLNIATIRNEEARFYHDAYALINAERRRK